MQKRNSKTKNHLIVSILSIVLIIISLFVVITMCIVSNI